jgi:hypothetical protein
MIETWPGLFDYAEPAAELQESDYGWAEELFGIGIEHPEISNIILEQFYECSQNGNFITVISD